MISGRSHGRQSWQITTGLIGLCDGIGRYWQCAEGLQELETAHAARMRAELHKGYDVAALRQRVGTLFQQGRLDQEAVGAYPITAGSLSDLLHRSTVVAFVWP